MSTTEPSLVTAIPDLRDIPADRLADLDSPVLADAIRLYRERLEASGEPPSSFNSRI